MTRIVRIALPFVLTFVFGVACTAVVRSVWPTQRTFSFGERSRCKWKSATLGPGRFEAVPRDSTEVVEVVELHEGARVNHFKVTVPNVYEGNWHLKERTLLGGRLTSGPRSKYVISYLSPEAIDGQPVTSNAAISHIPQPRFWREQGPSPALGCNALVRVELDTSGKVSEVVKVPGYADGCRYTHDILEAAEQISFRPAYRNGVPVTQRTSIFYRLD